MGKLQKAAVALLTGLSLMGGALVLAQPASAAGCYLVAYNPVKTSYGTVKGTGGVYYCVTPRSVTVAIKGVRSGGLPDSVLATTTMSMASLTWYAQYSSPTKGSEYRTQSWSSGMKTEQSGTLKW